MHLFDLCITPYQKIFHLCDGGQHCGRGKRATRWKPATISRLVLDLPTVDWRESPLLLNLIGLGS